MYHFSLKSFICGNIQLIVAPIAMKYDADRVYLFGSYARGELLTIPTSPPKASNRDRLTGFPWNHAPLYRRQEPLP